ncbi:uncharacterized protein L969DRAFT_52334 [Mixia osmundae IAM 14324]|uniref:N-acetyltransferase domain-containing protein n=1 Tax=Mixia osmundae (strain CBS 9802 / IAM 14324 / JCM 22182 / KY 12970) TaxID=764103 RepID=G7EA72_MIXOS|nr:uncharacterized protein L969DRAFT_52334 [Mixia osmundae IAM 14324]KEI37630.1 hypothetical protein L969DRAFT_52334 [Mixia osmundae IAM 14324]GAA99732.1 hypothetical protein E5Q_06435 [Mixia osmundae IAM 14324]
MSLLRPFRATDIFSFNNINLDPWTETYSVAYYLGNLATWPHLFSAQENAQGKLMGYVMGKTEGPGTEWHGHVTAITVSPEHRRLGLAKGMMALLEKMSELHRAYFVDLYVRVSNNQAIDMYEGLGYSVYRRVIGYYSGGVKPGEEDAFDMRKALSRDVKQQSVRANGRDHRVSPSECWT